MLAFNFQPFPIIETERLILRKLRLEDADDMFSMRSNPIAMQYIPRPIAQKIEDAIELINTINERLEKGEGINLAITLKGEDKCIGLIGYYRTKFEHYRSEIGYMIHPDYHRRGIAYEALMAATEYGFNEMNLHSIEAVINPIKIGSARVLEKANYVKEAYFKENEFYNGKFIDTVYYSKVKLVQ